MLKTKYRHSSVTIIESKNVGIVGVGESSTEHWGDFCNFVGINQMSAITRANATFKVGVYFDKWTDEDFMHCVGVGALGEDQLLDKYYHNAAYVIANSKPNHWMQTPMTWQNKISTRSLVDKHTSPTPQFQFDTHALNVMLHDACEELGIDIVVDDLVDLEYKDENIYALRSEHTKYYADFFIDCSGFRRFLSQDTPWKSYSEYLPLNSAITFATNEMEEYNKYTKCTARSSGWSWQIPTQTRTGNGYVFCDEFIDPQTAMEEMNLFHVDKQFKFDPGRLENAWVNNCFAVGLSQSFVEPLEATSIGSAIQSMFCFLHHFPSYDRDGCNREINYMFDNIAEYVQAHYLTQREDTPFWRYIKYDLKLLPGLQETLDRWKHRMPLETDIQKRWGLFDVKNYIPVLYGLKWFNSDVIRKEFDLHGHNHSYYETRFERNHREQKDLLWISHKHALELINTAN